MAGASASLVMLVVLGASAGAVGSGVSGAGTAPDAELAARFALLRTPPRASVPDEVARAARSSLRRGSQRDASEARFADTPAGPVSVSVSPVGDGLCVAFSGAVSCAEQEAALAGRAMVVQFCASDLPAGTTRLAGILPDGAGEAFLSTSEGDIEEIGLDNGVFGRAVRGFPVELQWEGADGQHAAPVPVPRDAADLLASCANAS